MPEGDTIHSLAAALHERAAGNRICHFDAWEPGLRDAPIVGHTLIAISATGKHLLMHLSNGLALASHLRMEGRWVFREVTAFPRSSGTLRVVLGFSQGALLGYQVRIARLVDPRRLAVDDPLTRLGPDPLSAGFQPEVAVRRLRGLGELPLGVALMRQSALAGLGNVYKSEVLFLAGLNPFLPVVSIDEQALHGAVTLAAKLLQSNVVAAKYGQVGRLTRISSTGGPRLWVYRRAGERCLRCDSVIRMRRQGTHVRSTYYCAVCQQVADG